MVGLQRGLPGARVVYCSATGASEPRNLGYMERLGLWGPGIPSFTNFQVCLGLWPASMMAWLGVNLRPFCLCHSLDAVRQELRYLSEVDIPVSSPQACLRLRIYSELGVRWTQKKSLEHQVGTKTAMFCRSIYLLTVCLRLVSQAYAISSPCLAGSSTGFWHCSWQTLLQSSIA